MGCRGLGFVAAHSHPPLQTALSSLRPQIGPRLASPNCLCVCLSVFQGPQGPQGPIGPPGEMGPKVSAEGPLFVPWCCWGGISSSETTSSGDPGLARAGGHVPYAAETEGGEGRCTLMAYGEELGSQSQGQ